MEQEPADQEPKPYANLRGRELVVWTLQAGEDRAKEVFPSGSIPRRYIEAVARSAGVSWPAGFFESSIEELMGKRELD